MKTKKIGAILLILFAVSSMYGQVIKSDKVYLKIEAPADEVVPAKTGETISEESDLIRPEIKIFSPALDSRSVFETSEPEIPVLGIVTDNNQIESFVFNSEILVLHESGQFTRRVELFPGENTIIIGALDNHQNYTEKRFIVNYVPIQVSLAEKVQKESKYYALIIGINNYPDPALNSLDNPVKDAQALYEVLTEKYTFEKDYIVFLKDAKRENIIYALDDYSRKVTKDDNLLIFYAGHGNFDEEANIGYWLPSNARKITTADWFGNSQLVDFLKKINSKHTLLITDACFSGSIFTARSAFADAPMAIEKLYELPSRKAMTSGRLTEVPDQSSFAKYLIERLDKNKDQYYSAADLFNSLRTAVLNNSDAVPQYGEIRNVGDEGGDFIFIRK